MTTPLPRSEHVDDVAAAVLVLADITLSGFVTGSAMHVDGDNLAAGRRHRADDGSSTT